ncbi:MAG: futalosine hydrolase [Bacteroidetes bacterium]|nr:MAG: futalosine hydrolase [Bacteroidota bacterium]
MNILIVAATAIEIKPFLQYLKKRKDEADIDVLITGIGLTATTYSLTKHFTIKKPDLVIQAGVAGCFDSLVELGEVLMIKQDTIADQSVVELKKLKTLFDLNLVPHDQHPYTSGWLINPLNRFLGLPGIKQVKGISVNQISTSAEMIKFYRKTFNPVTESMEGAALHYVCLIENIPFIQLRSISNYIGERNKKKWDMQDSIKNLNKELIKLVKKVS